MMKRLSSSDSMCGLVSNSPDEQSPRGYGSNFQSMLDGYEEDGTIIEEYSGNQHHMGLSEKKRRLRVDQVKALEKNFELENKLEPERKTKLAQELGLQPRQVAVWFQNRRARWKTKQLEKDYGLLKSQYDSLRHNFDSLRRDNDSLLQEISKMKGKINGEEDDQNNNNNVKAAATMESDISAVKEEDDQIPSSPPQFLEHSTGFNYRRSFTDLRDLLPNPVVVEAGSSDSCDSSAVLNEETSSENGRLTPPPPAAIAGGSFLQFVKTEQTEDHDEFFSGEEACGFFSDEQPPSLNWYSASDQWT